LNGSSVLLIRDYGLWPLSQDSVRVGINHEKLDVIDQEKAESASERE
jgi:hypothetical protein